MMQNCPVSKKLIFALTALVLISVAVSSAAESPLTGYVEGVNVNLRSKPSVSSEAVMQFPGGELVEILEKAPLKDGEKHPWYRVMSEDGSQGWIYGQFLAAGRLPPRFAMADPKGGRLIISGGDEDSLFRKVADQYTRCVFEDGLYKIEFEESRKAHPEWNGRELDLNFDKMGGLVYRVKEGPLPVPTDAWGGAEALIADEKYLEGAEALRLTRKTEKGSKDAAALFEKKYGRPLKDIYIIARGKDFEAEIYAMEFEVQGKKALGVVALVTPEGTLHLDFPAEWNEQSVWHVDDEGNFYPEYYSVGALIKRGDGLEFTLHNPAAESLTARLVINRGGKLAAPGGIMLNRYAAPE